MHFPLPAMRIYVGRVFPAGKWFCKSLAVSNALLCVQYLLDYICTEAYNAQPEMCKNLRSYLFGNSLREAHWRRKGGRKHLSLIRFLSAKCSFQAGWGGVM